MNMEELVAITMPNTIGTAKLSTAEPPHTAIGSKHKNVVRDV